MIFNASIEQNSTIRKCIYWDIEEKAAEDCLYIYGYQEHTFLVIREWIQNYEESGSFNPMSFIVNAESVYNVSNKVGGEEELV